jgi:short-subunit dehydrogenase
VTTGCALVTGACSGIGLEIARELAGRGHPLVLVSNREAELVVAARQLADEHKVATHAIAMDLAQPGAALSLYEEVQRRGLEVEILVSNAGVFFFGEATEADPSRVNTLLQLHVVTPSLLARYFTPDMRARRCGHVLFVSSVSAWRDFPGIAYYGASKRFLRSFAAALREELRMWGVNVTCLAPGAVATNLYDRSKVPVEAAVKYGVMVDPARVAKAAVRGMFRRKAVVIPGLSAKVTAVVMTVVPKRLIRLLQARVLTQPRE